MLTLVWSEFGRRGEENGSDGTDHGAAGAAFLIGSRARGKMVGEFPGLASGLDRDGNLRPTSDFRGVYCALLEQWLGADARGVIPGAQVVRAAGARQVIRLLGTARPRRGAELAPNARPARRQRRGVPPRALARRR